MAIGTFKQDPTARLDYPIDWAAPKEEGGPYLEAGDSIASATARVVGTATGIEVESPVVVQDNITIVWVVTTGAAPGRYTVTVAVVTTDGREDERSITVVVADQ